MKFNNANLYMQTKGKFDHLVRFNIYPDESAIPADATYAH